MRASLGVSVKRNPSSNQDCRFWRISLDFVAECFAADGSAPIGMPPFKDQAHGGQTGFSQFFTWPAAID